VPVDEVAELLRRWREAGGAWSRGRVLLDAAQLAGRLTPEERRTVAATLAETGAPDLARQLETRTGQPVDASHLQAFADGLLELEGARLDQVIAALEVADARLDDDLEPPDDLVPPPPPPGPAATAVAGQDESLDERLRDLAALEHLGDEELQGIRLGEIELGTADLGSQDLGEVVLGEAGLGPAPVMGTAAAVLPAVGGSATRDDTPAALAAEEPVAAEEPDDAAPGEPDDAAPEEPDDAAPEVATDAAPEEPADAPLVPATAAPDELAPRTTADALARLRDRLGTARTATARLTALSPEATRDLDAPAALLLLDEVPAGWQRRRAAHRLLAAGALAGVEPGALLARFPDARDRRFVAADLVHVSELAPEDLASELPPQVVRRLAIRAER
jgi:hypothetical protein